MRAKLTNSAKLLQLVVVLILTLLVAITIWKVFFTNNELVAKEYHLLASISPETIISLQQSRPDSWKDYTAVSTATNHISTGEQEQILRTLLTQLDGGTAFSKLNWWGIDRNVKKAAQYYRKLLDKYSIFTSGKYAFPLAQPCYYIDTYGAKREGGARSHQGTDLFDKKSTPILSVCPGTVERMGWNRLGGERVGVRGDDGNYYYYAHLDTINQELYIDKKIKKGDLLGTMGNTGDAVTTPDHLHFGIELPNGEWLNPYPFLKVWEYHKFGSAKK